MKTNLLENLGRPTFVLAPMVDGSELAWRMLGRKHGVQLTFTPMINSKIFLSDIKYRKSCMQFSDEDRPLIIQLCSNNPETFVGAAKYLEPYCDAIDLNLGCPQSIAKRGHYGAYLEDEWDLIKNIVSFAVKNLSVPVTCKIRVFDDIEKTVEYAKMLESAGAAMLTVHGRTREMKGIHTGLANWSKIKAVKKAVSIPVIANGNIQYLSDVDQCLLETGADAVMSAEGHLHNPALFSGEQPLVYDMCMQYMDLVQRYPTTLQIVRGHIFKLCQHALVEHSEMRSHFASANNFDELLAAIKALKEKCHQCKGNTISVLHLPHWLCQPYKRPNPPDSNAIQPVINEKSLEYRNQLAIERKARKMAKRKLNSSPEEI